MTKDQIKAELRRSACEDESPYWHCDANAWLEAQKMAGEDRSTSDMKVADLRTFFLLVAEAL